MFSEQSKVGKVYLVGAGPGDPDLITLRGWKILNKAEVVVYDRLANPELLSEAPESAEHIYVGKAAGKPSASQDQINNILVSKAREGKTVIRLKGGDPFVFGRGGEELQVLAAEGISFEVVPGISSSIAAPAYAGIPLTHRHYSSSFTVITGHSINKDGFPQDWKSLAKLETLVILMGFRKLGSIARHLQQAGKSPSTPVAVIEKATYGSQKVVKGTLSTIERKARELSTPATIIVGEVAALGHHLDWFNKQDGTGQTYAPSERSFDHPKIPALAHS